MTTISRLTQPNTLAVLAGVVGGLVIIAYLAIMAAEHNDSLGQIAGWALAMGIPCVLAFASPRLPRRTARWMLVAATVLFVGLGVVTSLGLAFLLAAALTGLAAFRTRESVSTTSQRA